MARAGPYHRGGGHYFFGRRVIDVQSPKRRPPTTALSKKLHSLPSSVRRIIQPRGWRVLVATAAEDRLLNTSTEPLPRMVPPADLAPRRGFRRTLDFSLRGDVAWCDGPGLVTTRSCRARGDQLTNADTCR